MTKGDTVYYLTQLGAVRAKVLVVHQDHSATIQAQFWIDPKTGDDQHNFLGFKYRLHQADLLPQLPAQVA